MPVRFQVDGDFYDHPKTIDASDAAVALWTRAGSYSTHKLLDGFVPDGMLARLSKSETPVEVAQELVRCGLWRRVRGGYRFHQWDHRNLTKARVEADREYDKAKKRRLRQNLRNGTSNATEGAKVSVAPQAKPTSVPEGRTGDVPRDIEGTPGGIPAVSVSVSESVSESVSGSGRADEGGSAPPGDEPPTRCEEHIRDPNPPPCGGCAGARKAHSQWGAAKAKWDRDAPRCSQHRGQPAHNCSICRSEQLGGR